jgi:cytidine deaminase
MDAYDLLWKANAAASHSYSPYSDFPVGAALYCSSGNIHTGTNVENRSFGLTNCAERSALFAAISAGEREFEALAVVAPRSAVPIPPCGACRQVLGEFVGGDCPVYFAGKDLTAYMEKSLKELLPYDSLHNLKQHP